MLVYPTINVLISIKDIDDRKVCESDEEQKCSLSATTLVNALNEFYQRISKGEIKRVMYLDKLKKNQISQQTEM